MAINIRMFDVKGAPDFFFTFDKKLCGSYGQDWS